MNNGDPGDTNEAFVKPTAFTSYPHLTNFYGRINTIWQAYGWTGGIPYKIFVDRDGKIRKSQLGGYGNGARAAYEPIVQELTGDYAP